MFICSWSMDWMKMSGVTPGLSCHLWAGCRRQLWAAGLGSSGPLVRNLILAEDFAVEVGLFVWRLGWEAWLRLAGAGSSWLGLLACLPACLVGRLVGWVARILWSCLGLVGNGWGLLAGAGSGWLVLARAGPGLPERRGGVCSRLGPSGAVSSRLQPSPAVSGRLQPSPALRMRVGFP